MSERPFMQLYVSDYLGDTRHLSCEQHGAYLLLLMTMWNASGSLPDNDAKLARIVCLSIKKWRAIRDDILQFFSVNDGAITHSRLTKELQKSESKSQSRASAGAEGGRAKALKDKETRLANAIAEPQHSPDTINKEEKREAKASPKKASRIPDDFEPDLQVAVEIGLTLEEAAFEASRMRDWSSGAPGQKGHKADWPATWRNWCRRIVADRREKRALAPPKKLTQGESLRNMAREAGVIDATGSPIRRLETSDRNRETSGVGDVVRLAVAGNNRW